MVETENSNKKYPYLGRNFIDGKAYVVLFSEEDMGTVVMNETNSRRIFR